MHWDDDFVILFINAWPPPPRPLLAPHPLDLPVPAPTPIPCGMNSLNTSIYVQVSLSTHVSVYLERVFHAASCVQEFQPGVSQRQLNDKPGVRSDQPSAVEVVVVVVGVVGGSELSSFAGESSTARLVD